MNDFEQEHASDGVAVAEKKPKLERPSMYAVVLINDDYTPMDFVVDVLEKVFGHNRRDSVRIMLDVHKNGRGVCGEYVLDVAETKVSQVTQFAQAADVPLLCIMEELS